MRRLIVFNMITVDGYFEGRQQDISWHRVDEEVNEYMAEQLKTADTLLFGRKTYQIMEDFWPTEAALQQDPEIAAMMGRYKKIVFSAAKEKTAWKNTRIVKENTAGEIRKLKEEAGKNMFVFGSAGLCKTLIKENLIDEIRIMINPVTLGKGNPFFYAKMNLQLLKVKVFGNGNVMLCYRPVYRSPET